MLMDFKIFSGSSQWETVLLFDKFLRTMFRISNLLHIRGIVVIAICIIYGRIEATSVKDFGAVGDGVTDDTEAIVTAIHAAEDGELFFSKGTYRISKSIEIELEKYGPLVIKGAAGASTIAMEGSGAAFIIRGTHEGSALPASVGDRVWAMEKFCIIESLEIVGKHEESDGIQLIGLMQPVVRNCLLRNVRYGIHLSNRNRNVLLLGNHIYNCRKIGVFLDEVNIHQININDNHISYCKFGGIVIRNSEIRNIQIVGNDIEYNFDADSETPSADLYFDISEKGSIREGTISGNNIQAMESPGGSNINFKGNPDNSVKIGLLSITGNHISNQETLVKLKNVKGVSITGNTFIRGYNRHMSIESSKNIVIQGNVFDHNTDYFKNNITCKGGIRLLLCRDIIFSDNILEGVNRGGLDRGGALEIEQSNRVSINTSHILNSNFRGIEVVRSEQVSITHCLLSNDSDEAMIDGILVRGLCNNLNIDQNRIDKTKRGQVFRIDD